MNIIIDDIFKKVDITSFLNLDVKKYKEELLIFTDGLISLIEDKIKHRESEDTKSIKNKNQNILKNALGILSIVFLIVIIFIFSLLIIGFSVPIKYEIKKNLLVVLFIALTEFAFLNLVVRNYISASPNYTKNILAKAILEYVNKR